LVDNTNIEMGDRVIQEIPHSSDLFSYIRYLRYSLQKFFILKQLDILHAGFQGPIEMDQTKKNEEELLESDTYARKLSTRAVSS